MEEVRATGLAWLKLLAWLDDLLTGGLTGFELLSSGEEDFLCNTCLELLTGVIFLALVMSLVDTTLVDDFWSTFEKDGFRTSSFGGELFLFGAGFTFACCTDDPALDNDSVDDLLEPVAF